jgi:[1-hydroxy-2-(trimethylamino)ethyl]phosphonate dioxygenase
MTTVDEILNLFCHKGHAAYFGEAVSQIAHALQTAHLAETAGASNALIVAALLHDVGHLLHGLSESIDQAGVDARHEDGGAAWLAKRFGPSVVDPVRLHVAAKRFLCATEPRYLDQLSPASLRSLALQGGPMNPAEIGAFQAEPFHLEAVALRRWDDHAKVPGLYVPGLEHYRQLLESALVPDG